MVTENLSIQSKWTVSDVQVFINSDTFISAKRLLVGYNDRFDFIFMIPCAVNLKYHFVLRKSEQNNFRFEHPKFDPIENI